MDLGAQSQSGFQGLDCWTVPHERREREREKKRILRRRLRTEIVLVLPCCTHTFSLSLSCELHAKSSTCSLKSKVDVGPAMP